MNFLIHLSFDNLSEKIILLLIDKKRAKVCLATEIEFIDEFNLITLIFFLLQPWMSIFSVFVPYLHITFKFFSFLIKSLSIFSDPIINAFSSKIFFNKF